MVCNYCKKEFESKRADAKYCSSKCRKDASRRSSIVTDNVTDNFVVDEPVEEREFKFTIKIGPLDKERGLVERKNTVRVAKYWYDVPLAALPVLEEGYPEMPEWMDGRVYFLWWKNNFKMADGKPVIFNPFPKPKGEVKYDMGGEASRKWGA